MLVQVQVVYNETDGVKTFKLVARIHTDNETGLVHQQVLDLDESLDLSFIKLLYPNMLNFEGITAVASPEVIANALKEQEEQAAKLKAETDAANIDFAPKEIVVEA
jgi:hypothetical protein